MRVKSLIGFILLLSAGTASVLFQREAGATGEGILSTKHNLSISGPGPIKALNEVRVCIFCHSPHHADSVTPLWSRPDVTTVYNVYSSSTRFAKPSQPTGSSRLCLSCHDGTIAVGALINNTTIAMAGGFTTIPFDRPSNLGGATGKELGNDHPISMQFTADLLLRNQQLHSPTQISGKLKLDANQNIQCTTCHNAHVDPWGNFLVMDNTGSAMCISCHNVTGWDGALHNTYGTLAAKGCENCHLPHNAKSPQRLMKEYPEENNCLMCHSPLGGDTNIFVTLRYAYTHPVKDYVGVHDPLENPLSAQKHVECEDCHNTHASKIVPAVAPNINGSMYGVKGVAITGEVKDAVYEYEVCFKCHASNNFFSSDIVRQVSTVDARLDFQPDNPSFHPVAGPGKATSIGSLRLDLGYSTTSIIYCTDCHGSDQSAKAGGGGGGANGPHGSKYKYILLNEYDTEFYPRAYSDSNYALCFRCHDQKLLFSASSPFFENSANLPLHDWHVKQKGIPCVICHDPHGVSQAKGGTVKGNAHLINFATSYKITGSYDSVGPPKSCSVSCHSSLDPRSYGPDSGLGKLLRQKRKLPAK